MLRNILSIKKNRNVALHKGMKINGNSKDISKYILFSNYLETIV